MKGIMYVFRLSVFVRFDDFFGGVLGRSSSGKLSID